MAVISLKYTARKWQSLDWKPSWLNSEFHLLADGGVGVEL